MTELILEATARSELKKGGARKLRRQGIIPGILYGRTDPLPVKVEEQAAGRLVHLLHGSERLVTLRLLGAADDKPQDKQVIIKAAQTDALGRQLLHLDFHEIDVSKVIHVSVELRAVGTPEGVRLGGVLQTVQREVAVECLATDIPEYIEVELSALEIGHSLHARDLTIPANVKLLTDLEETLFVVAAQMREEEEVTEEEGEEMAEEAAAETPEAAEPEPTE